MKEEITVWRDKDKRVWRRVLEWLEGKKIAHQFEGEPEIKFTYCVIFEAEPDEFMEIVKQAETEPEED